VTISYNAVGGVLEGSTNVWLHSGYNKFEGTDWQAAYALPMIEIGENLWEITVTMTNEFKTFNMLFNDPDADAWDNEYDQIHWVIFPGAE
jgi:hypothetical protein